MTGTHQETSPDGMLVSKLVSSGFIPGFSLFHYVSPSSQNQMLR